MHAVRNALLGFRFGLTQRFTNGGRHDAVLVLTQVAGDIYIGRSTCNYKTVNRVCVKDVNIFYWVKKRLVWGVLEIEEIRDKNNATGLKEEGVIQISICSAFPYT